jgi:prolyl 4-hydroxylase
MTHPDQTDGRAAARQVAETLKAKAGVRKVPTRAFELFIVPGFLNEHSCNEMIARIERERRPSTIADDVGIANFRTSETCDLDSADPEVRSVDRAICSLLGLHGAFGEPIQGQRYDVGQEFRPHTDTFNPGQADYYLHCADWGQRTWTAMVYLNDVPAGGATRFKLIGKTIQPVRGTLLAWHNLLPDGRPNDATLHQGMKVRAGAKYILTKWYRERPVTSGSAADASYQAQSAG